MKYINSLVLAATMTAFSASACDRHFGGGFGSFANYHPMLKEHSQAKSYERMSFIHAKKSLVTANKESNFSITYRVPATYREVSLAIESSEHIELLQDINVSILKASGVLRVKYKAMQKGEHSIRLIVTAQKGTKEESFTQSVDVVAS